MDNEKFSKPYTGPLLEPIDITSPFPTCHIQAEDWYYVQFCERLPLLFQHYEIDPDTPYSYMLLAMALAEQHVPGFSINQLENEAKWQGVEGLKLYVQVRWIHHQQRKAYQKGRKPSIRGAIKAWLELHGLDIDPNLSSHQSRYYEIQKNHPVIREALKSHVHNSSIKKPADLDTYFFNVFEKLLPLTEMLQKLSPKL
jgi:hypothetical protein